jgi:hypothetical protein
MNISMTFDVPADAAGEVASAVEAALNARYVKQCEIVASANDGLAAAERLNAVLASTAAARDDVVEQLKGLRRDIRNLDVPA